jgi:hypothetical protein
MAHNQWFRVGTPVAVRERSQCSGEKPASFDRSVWQPAEGAVDDAVSFRSEVRDWSSGSGGPGSQVEVAPTGSQGRGAGKPKPHDGGERLTSSRGVRARTSSSAVPAATRSTPEARSMCSSAAPVPMSSTKTPLAPVRSSKSAIAIRSPSHRALPAVTSSSDADRKTAGHPREYRDQAHAGCCPHERQRSVVSILRRPGQAVPDQSCMPRTAIFLCPTA